MVGSELTLAVEKSSFISERLHHLKEVRDEQIRGKNPQGRPCATFYGARL